MSARIFFFRIYRYLRYLLFARHRKGHGIHSPFVFNLITVVFRNKISPEVVLEVERIRKKNFSDRRIIKVNDLGAGPVTMKSNNRTVSEIVMNSAVPRKFGILLANLASEFGNPSVVELGTSLGISTMYLAAGCPGSIIYTVEGCAETSEIAKQNFSAAGLENITLLNTSFDEAITRLTDIGIKPGLVYIDGHHRKEHLLRYFRQFSAIAGKNTLIIIDDIHYSQEIEEAWENIRNSGNISCTIDIFRMGLVFFREGMSRTDYVIRY